MLNLLIRTGSDRLSLKTNQKSKRNQTNRNDKKESMCNFVVNLFTAQICFVNQHGCVAGKKNPKKKICQSLSVNIFCRFYLILLTLSVDKDESGKHKKCMQIVHFTFIILIGKTFIIFKKPIDQCSYRTE